MIKCNNHGTEGEVTVPRRVMAPERGSSKRGTGVGKRGHAYQCIWLLAKGK